MCALELVNFKNLLSIWKKIKKLIKKLLEIEFIKCVKSYIARGAHQNM